MVGTPGNQVARYFSMTSKIVWGLNRSTTTTAPPELRLPKKGLAIAKTCTMGRAAIVMSLSLRP